MVMPGIDGMALLHEIKKLHPAAKVIMLTAFATIDTAVEAIKRGAMDYISKPFRVEDLIALINRAFEEKRLESTGGSEVDLDGTFSCLSHPLRRRVLQLLSQQPRHLMDLTRTLGVEDHTKMVFHLKLMKQARLIRQDEHRAYHLTEEGKRVVDLLQWVEEFLG
jgi:FixJ family two-component response regulator